MTWQAYIIDQTIPVGDGVGMRALAHERGILVCLLLAADGERAVWPHLVLNEEPNEDLHSPHHMLRLHSRGKLCSTM